MTQELTKILKVLEQYFKVSSGDIIFGARGTHNVSFIRQVLAHLAMTHGISAKLLSLETSYSAVAWSKAYNVMQSHLDADGEKAATYYKIKDILYPPPPPPENKGKIPTLTIKWSVADDIRIEQAMKSAAEYMKNYGKSR